MANKSKRSLKGWGGALVLSLLGYVGEYHLHIYADYLSSSVDRAPA